MGHKPLEDVSLPLGHLHSHQFSLYVSLLSVFKEVEYSCLQYCVGLLYNEMDQLCVYTYPFPVRPLSQPVRIPTVKVTTECWAPCVIRRLPTSCLFSHTAVRYLLINRALNKWAFSALLATRDEGLHGSIKYHLWSIYLKVMEGDGKKELWNILSPSSLPPSPCRVFWMFLSWICCPDKQQRYQLSSEVIHLW